MNQPNQALTQFKRELFKTNGLRYQTLLGTSDDGRKRYLAEVYEVINTNPKLLSADRQSLHGAIGTAAAMNLSIMPQLGEAWLIPRKNRVQFQIGYKGLVKLAHRSGVLDSLFVEVAYRGEDFSYRGGTNPGIDHAPDDEKRTNKFDDIVAAYAVAWVKGSTRPTFRVVTARELRLAKQSTDAWKQWAEAMAKKVALTRLAGLLPRTDKLRDLHLVSDSEHTIEAGKVPGKIVTLPDFDVEDESSGGGSLGDRMRGNAPGDGDPRPPVDVEATESGGK